MDSFLVSDCGHFNISQGARQVDYAGTVRFSRSDSSRGSISYFTNGSGHYKPTPDAAFQSGFPIQKFLGYGTK